MEEGQGQGGLASSRQYGNALLGVRHQEEEEVCYRAMHYSAKRDIEIACRLYVRL